MANERLKKNSKPLYLPFPGGLNIAMPSTLVNRFLVPKISPNNSLTVARIPQEGSEWLIL